MKIWRWRLITSFILFLSCHQSVLAGKTPVGWGTVNMQGAIIDTACAIAAGSREQTIDMGIVPIGDIIRDGRGSTRPFSIELINCSLSQLDPVLPVWRQFQVIFDGERDGSLFGVNGEAKGVGLLIVDDVGNRASPGQALPLSDVFPEDMHLNYTMTVVSNSQPLRSGFYSAAVRFKLDYY